MFRVPKRRKYDALLFACRQDKAAAQCIQERCLAIPMEPHCLPPRSVPYPASFVVPHESREVFLRRHFGRILQTIRFCLPHPRSSVEPKDGCWPKRFKWSGNRGFKIQRRQQFDLEVCTQRESERRSFLVVQRVFGIRLGHRDQSCMSVCWLS